MAKNKTVEGSAFVRYFGPLLDALRGLGGSGTPDEVMERIANDLKLPDTVQNELMSSGQPRFRNQVAWARYYLVREGLVDSSKRGVWSLTERGRTTKLSPEQAREVFQRGLRFYYEQRRAKAQKPEPLEEVVAEGTGATSNDYRAATLRTTACTSSQWVRAARPADTPRSRVRSGYCHGKQRRRRHRRLRHPASQPTGVVQGAVSVQALHQVRVAFACP